MRIAITGGSGFVGRRLVARLLERGDQVLVLTRNLVPARRTLGDPANLKLLQYDPYQPETWATALEGYEGIVNLAGEPLAASRWTEAKKKEIRRSRVETTQALVQAIASLTQKPQVMVSSSAVGYYGSHPEADPLPETAPPAQDFLATVCQAWEAAARPVQDLGIRLAIVRTGIVLGPDGGALGQMLAPFQLFIGGTIGSGKQWLSWIHREDFVSLVCFLLKQGSGIFNGTAPNPVRMEEFCQTLGQVLARPSWLPVPELALELLLGEAAQVVLTGQRVLPQAALEAGFTFQYPHLKEALRQILIP
ncbi:TIGR01777 family oxidoreductase [Synechococcus sp. Nb3U1]|uniref:thylakoid membrane protein ThyD n=1 Tax=Synechococcus sp. Nb3U1 TaxID=1914529 RepID=UPI001F376DE9|nr:TIGR01777 family oxidoreductase [Synechococcus sp. Nb3U1]MCF2971750.1 TIGR01777 family oxidoreductase [Synechococcus sp. Nb3U1]